MVKSAVPKDNTEYPDPDPTIVYPEYLGRDAAGNDVIVKDAAERKERIKEVVQTPEQMSRLSKEEREKPPSREVVAAASAKEPTKSPGGDKTGEPPKSEPK